MSERITAEQVHGWAECLFSISREDGGLEDFYPQEMANDLYRLSRQLAQDAQRIAELEHQRDGLIALPNTRAEQAEARVKALEQERDEAIARAVIAENHRTLELMSRGSAADERELRLRAKLAEAELTRDAAQVESTRNVEARRTLMEALKRYGRHTNCPLESVRDATALRCTCGFEAALAAAEEGE